MSAWANAYGWNCATWATKSLDALRPDGLQDLVLEPLAQANAMALELTLD